MVAVAVLVVQQQRGGPCPRCGGEDGAQYGLTGRGFGLFIVFDDGRTEHPETPRSAGEWRLSCRHMDVLVSRQKGMI